MRPLKAREVTGKETIKPYPRTGLFFCLRILIQFKEGDRSLKEGMNTEVIWSNPLVLQRSR